MTQTTKTVLGIGVNDWGSPVYGNPPDPIYPIWYSMLRRVKASKGGLKLDPVWRSFSNFREWVENQDWQDKQLDKDIKGEGKCYGPQQCLFVPQWLNNWFKPNRKTSCIKQHGNKFQVRVGVGQGRYVGLFSTWEEAVVGARVRKLELILPKVANDSREFVQRKILTEAYHRC